MEVPLIPFFDLQRRGREQQELELAVMGRVLRSPQCILGPEVLRFETEFAKWCKLPNCIGVGNGLDAIEISLRASGVGASDEIIVPAVSAYATLLGVVRSGATPVVADIDVDTGLLSPSSVSRCLTKRTRGVLVVHLYGQVRGMQAWQQLCASARVRLYEDSAQAHGACEDGHYAGGFGTCGAYSFYPTKNLGAVGDGGAVVCLDTEIADRARMLRNYGQKNRYEHVVLGLNSRLDEVQAAVLSARLKLLESENARRREVANIYRAELAGSPWVQLLAPPISELSHVYHLFVVRCEDRRRVQALLEEHRIQSLIHYPVPAHQQAANLCVRCDPLGLPSAESFSSQCLSLPCYPWMTDAEVEKVIEVLGK